MILPNGKFPLSKNSTKKLCQTFTWKNKKYGVRKGSLIFITLKLTYSRYSTPPVKAILSYAYITQRRQDVSGRDAQLSLYSCLGTRNSRSWNSVLYPKMYPKNWDRAGRDTSRRPTDIRSRSHESHREWAPSHSDRVPPSNPAYHSPRVTLTSQLLHCLQHLNFFMF